MKIIKLKNQKNLAFKFSSGFTLIEVMAAVTILTIGILGGLKLINYNLRDISSGEKRIVASGLAQEGIELVRNIRDTNWLQGLSWDTGFGIPNVGDRKRVKFFCGGFSFISEAYTRTIDNCPNGGPNVCTIAEYKIGSGDPICYSDDFGNNYTYNAVTYDRVNPRTLMKRLIFVERMTANSIRVDVYLGWDSATGVFKTLSAQETLYNWK